MRKNFYYLFLLFSALMTLGCFAWILYCENPEISVLKSVSNNKKNNGSSNHIIQQKTTINQINTGTSSINSSGAVSLEEIKKIKEFYFKQKNSAIHQDEYGNQWVKISTEQLDSRVHIISSWPIRFPSERQLNEGVQGCALGGYYVDLQASFALVIHKEDSLQVYYYVCGYHEYSQSYQLVPVEKDNKINLSIEKRSFETTE